MNRRKPWGLYAYAVLAYSFLFAPMVLVVLNSVNKDQFRTHWAGLTFEWYRAAWSDPTIVDAAKNSLVIATLVAVLSTIIGTSTSLSLQRSRRWMHAVISSTTYSRLIIPEILLALALLIMFSRIGIARGTTTIVIGQVVFNSAYITVVVSARLAVRERHTEEAARDLGATAFRAFRRVTLPEIMPAIIAGAVLAFTFSLDNIVTSFFLSGSTNTLPLVILSLIRFEVSPVVNALGTTLTLANALLMAIFLVVSWRRSVGSSGRVVPGPPVT